MRRAADGSDVTPASRTALDMMMLSIWSPSNGSIIVARPLALAVMGGLEATKVILDGDQDPPPRILIVTTFDQDEHVFEALRGGASGFVLKDTQPEKLLDAITIVAAGEALLAPAITRRLIAEFAEIAAALYLSVATVKTHVSRLLDKLGCRDRAQLVVVAYETGVAIPGRQLR